LIQDRNGSENFKNRALIRLKTHIGIGVAGGELEVEARNCREAADTLRECLKIIGTGITKAPIHGIPANQLFPGGYRGVYRGVCESEAL